MSTIGQNFSLTSPSAEGHEKVFCVTAYADAVVFRVKDPERDLSWRLRPEEAERISFYLSRASRETRSSIQSYYDSLVAEVSDVVLHGPAGLPFWLKDLLTIDGVETLKRVAQQYPANEDGVTDDVQDANDSDEPDMDFYYQLNVDYNAMTAAMSHIARSKGVTFEEAARIAAVAYDELQRQQEDSDTDDDTESVEED